MVPGLNEHKALGSPGLVVGAEQTARSRASAMLMGVKRGMGPGHRQAPPAWASILSTSPSNLTTSAPFRLPKAENAGLHGTFSMKSPGLAVSGGVFAKCPGTKVLVLSKLVLETFLFLVSSFCSQPPHPKLICDLSEGGDQVLRLSPGELLGLTSQGDRGSKKKLTHRKHSGQAWHTENAMKAFVFTIILN